MCEETMCNMWSCVFPFYNVQNYHGNLGFLSWNIIENSLKFFKACLWEPCTGNTLYVMICDNLLHSLSDLNDTTCPRPRKGAVADLAVLLSQVAPWVVIMTAGGAARDSRAVGLATFDLSCGLSIYHDRFTCVCDCIVQFYLQMYSMYIYRINDFWFWFWFCIVA